jgi:hypothetical protein
MPHEQAVAVVQAARWVAKHGPKFELFISLKNMVTDYPGPLV